MIVCVRAEIVLVGHSMCTYGGTDRFMSRRERAQRRKSQTLRRHDHQLPALARSLRYQPYLHN